MKHTKFELLGQTSGHMTRDKISGPRRKHCYPSEASVVRTNEHGEKENVGGCLRKSYFRLSGDYPGEKFNERTMWTFQMGNTVEDMLVDRWKEMGIWLSSQVEFYDAEHNLSGKLDAVVKDPINGYPIGIEIKSFAGYYAQKSIMGNKSTKGYPKWAHLLQTALYLNQFKEKLQYFKLVYFNRAEYDKMREFDITLHPEGDLLYIAVDGIPDKSFTMNDVYARYKELMQAVELKVVPPPDYQIRFTDERIEQLYSRGEIAKSKYENWKRGRQDIGNWNCSYCNYSDICWGE